LKELLQSSRYIPSVNQVEFSPFLYQRELLDFCNDNKIQLEAYSPLTRGKKFSHKTIRSISSKYQKTPAQIFLRWALQHEVAIIPKSANADRLRENANIFDFSIEQEDMDLLDSLNENFRVSWDPTGIP
jgi:diketogulonate reductase-like aldo/keto reductase